jgi:hypothetical protein
VDIQRRDVLVDQWRHEDSTHATITGKEGVVSTRRETRKVD